MMSSKELIRLALPYMKSIIAADSMEAWMRETWIKSACAILGVEDDGIRHPAVMELMKESNDRQ